MKHNTRRTLHKPSVRTFRFSRFTVELHRFINRQCIGVGLTVNWNFRPSLELDLIQWRLYVEYKTL